MKKLKTIRNKPNSDRYLITYADLVSLLLGLFVILYSTSKVDNEKFVEVQKALENVFKYSGENSVLDGGSGVLDGTEDVLPEPIIPSFKRGDIVEIEQELKLRLTDFTDKFDIKIYREANSLKLELPEKLLFKSGNAEVQNEGLTFLDTLSTLLNGLPNQIKIDGHTDNVPINNFVYSSNWHLSSARSLNVADAMFENGLKQHNIAIRAFGSQRPVESNSTKSGKKRNRRVDISISEMDTKTPTKVGYQIDSLDN